MRFAVLALLIPALASAKPPVPNKPSVDVVRIDDRGLPSNADDDRTLKAGRGRLTTCYRTVIEKHGRFEGSLPVEITISKGNATARSLPGPMLSRPMAVVRACLFDEIKKLSFGDGDQRTMQVRVLMRFVV